MFQGGYYAGNLRVVAGLDALAGEFGFTLPQLAIGWTLTNPAVDVAIVAPPIATMSTRLWRRP